MRRRRKPVVRPMADITEALVWRSRLLCEMLEAIELPAQMSEPIRKLLDAVDDYEVSKGGKNGLLSFAEEALHEVQS